MSASGHMTDSQSLIDNLSSKCMDTPAIIIKAFHKYKADYNSNDQALHLDVNDFPSLLNPNFSS